jgi:hypothetical protein
MRSGSFAFFRLAAMIGVAFLVAYVYVRWSAPAGPSSASGDAATASVEHAAPATRKAEARVEQAPSEPPAAAPAAPADSASTDSGSAGEPAANAPAHTGTLPAETRVAEPARAPTTSDVIAPPPATDAALVVDAQKLRQLMDRGTPGLSAKTDLDRVKGMRLVGIAAALGSASARRLVVQEFPHSAVVRAVVPPADVIRDALDPFTGDPAAGSDSAPFAALATYFASRKALPTFAAYLVDAVRDDRRLQSRERLNPAFDALAGVSGACVAMARIIAVPHSDSPPECPTEFRDRVLAHVRAAGATGRDAAARRIALTLMQRLDSPPGAPRVAGSGGAAGAPSPAARSRDPRTSGNRR